MICENCCYSVYECEGWEWFLVDCKRGQQLTKDEEYGFINRGLEECNQYRKRRVKKVYREEDVRMAMQIAAAILIICFIVSRF